MRQSAAAFLFWLMWCLCTSAPTSITVTSIAGQCMSLIFADGFAHQCFDSSKISRIPLDQLRASEALLMLYDQASGRIRDMSIIPPGFEGMIESSSAEVTADGNAVAANVPIFHLLWPKAGETVTTRDIDFRYDWSMPAELSATPGSAALCIVLTKSSNGSEFQAYATNASNLDVDTMVVVRCSENTVTDRLGSVLTLTLGHSGRSVRFEVTTCSHQVTPTLSSAAAGAPPDTFLGQRLRFSLLPPTRTNPALPRSYHVRFFLFHARHSDAADPDPSPGTVQAARQARFAQMAVDRALPQPSFELRGLTVDLPADAAGANAVPSDDSWLGRIRVLRSLAPAGAPGAPAPVGDVGATAHVLVISAFSTGRYEEAETMLKSLFLHRTAPRPLVLHLVVDDGGRAHFEALFAQPALRRAPHLAVVMHDFDAVCGAPLGPFLEGPLRGMRQSFHHSGKVGCCRPWKRALPRPSRRASPLTHPPPTVHRPPLRRPVTAACSSRSTSTAWPRHTPPTSRVGPPGPLGPLGPRGMRGLLGPTAGRSPRPTRRVCCCPRPWRRWRATNSCWPTWTRCALGPAWKCCL